MFEKAARLKLRFDSTKGQLTAEDLWDLSLIQLNTMAINLLNQKKRESVSFIEPAGEVDPKVTLAFDIVVYVIKTRQEESARARLLQDRAGKKQKLLSILADKEESALTELSPDELRKMIEGL